MKNVCAQHYHINRLRLADGRWLDLRNLDAMFFPLSKTAALVTMARHENILAGMPIITPSLLLKIEAIEYTVTACAGNGVVTEDFLHKFKVRPRLITKTLVGNTINGDTPTRWPVYLLEASRGSLFTTAELDLMLSTKVFGPIQGAQFCC